MECEKEDRIKKLEGELAGLGIAVTQMSQLLCTVLRDLRSCQNKASSGFKVRPVSDANNIELQRIEQEASKNVCHLTIL